MSNTLRWVIQGRNLCCVLLLALPWAGCRMLRDTPDDEALSTAAEDDRAADDKPLADLALKALANQNWVWAVTPPSAAPEHDAEPAYRWRHAEIDLLLGDAASPHAALRQALDADNGIVVANAAIALARIDVAAAPHKQLIAAVRDRQLKLSLRQAAAEMLGRCTAPAAGQGVRTLVEEYGRYQGEFATRYVPDLHAELLRALAQHAELTDPLFEPALASPSPAVRLEAARLWSVRPCGDLPAKLVDLRTDADARVRAAVVAAVAVQGHPRAHELVEAALGDFELSVRLAAIAALGKLGDEDSRQNLRRLMASEAELVRTAAIAALAQAGDDESLRDAAADKSWRVRTAVAKALAERADSPLATLASDLLRDDSPQVQQQMIESLADWPQEQAGPLLLAALDGSTYLARKEARRQLALRWPQAEEFAIDAPPERRAEVLASLRDRWRQQFGDAAAAIDAGAAAAGASQAGNLPQMAAALAALTDKDPSGRRRAADRLLEQASKGPLDAATIAAVAAQVAADPDALVWRSVLLALKDDAGDEACRLACAGIGHPSADVRRLACEHLARHGQPQHAEVLTPSLGDSDQTVVRVAAAALGRIGGPVQIAALEELLDASDKTVRIAAASSLARLGAETGPTALERLALDTDPRVRQQAAAAMGSLQQVEFVSTLIGLLDDQGGVRQAALASLVRIVGRDVARPTDPDEPAPDTVETIRRWKEWHRAAVEPESDSGQ